MKICNVKTTRSRKSVGGIFGNLDSLKNMRSRNCGGGGGVRGIWKNPDLTGFSLMTAPLRLSLKFEYGTIRGCICKLWFGHLSLSLKFE